MTIERDEHLYPALVQFLCEARTYLSQRQGDREAVSLLANADALIRRANTAARGSGKREGTKESEG